MKLTSGTVKTIVETPYQNNFDHAESILDARNLYPDCSIADLYDDVTMPPELRKAHQENDRAVMDAYGFNPRMSESEIVSELFRMYQALITSLFQ